MVFVKNEFYPEDRVFCNSEKDIVSNKSGCFHVCHLDSKVRNLENSDSGKVNHRCQDEPTGFRDTVTSRIPSSTPVVSIHLLI